MRTVNFTDGGCQWLRYLRIVQQAQWMAYWQNTNGKRSVRSFNVSKYGEEGARQLAIRARQDGMAEVARQLQLKAAQSPAMDAD